MNPILQSTQRKRISKPLRILIAAGAAVGALLALALLAFWLALGQGMGVRETLKAFANTALAALNANQVKQSSRGAMTNVIFLHHSTGRNLMEQGGMRALFTQAGYDFWDQDYNDNGMRQPDGWSAPFLYWNPGDNTDPIGLEAIFSQPVYGLPLNTLSGLLQHEVIILKSCFPNSHITSEAQFETMQQRYLAIRSTLDEHPDRLFILLNSPPLNPAETNADAAARGRRMADWLRSDDFLGGRANLFVFDFYGALVENDPAAADYNMLRAAYRNGADSHPNAAANQAIAPLLVQFVIEKAENFR